MSPRFLIALALAAFSARAAAILLLGGADPTSGAHEHAYIAREIAAGNGFRLDFFGPPAPTSHQAPLVSYTLAALYRVFGADSAAAHRAWQLLAGAAGAGACLVLALIGARIGGARLGRAAGVIAAAYPPLVYAPLRVQTVNVTIPALALLVWLAQRALADPQSIGRDRSRPAGLLGAAALLGGTGGIAMLAEPILAAPLAVLLLWVGFHAWRSTKSMGWSLALPLAGLAAAALVLLPWTARNWLVHGRPVLVKNCFGYVLWQGNHEGASGTDKLPVAAASLPRIGAAASPSEEEAALNRVREDARSVDDELPAEFVAELRRQPTEIRRMDLFRDRALGWISAHPAEYLKLSLRRLGYLLWFDPTNPRSFSWYYRVSYLALLALAVPGLLLSLKRIGAWAPLYLAAGAQAAVHVLVITSARFRLPLEMCLIVPAALAVSAALQTISTSRSASQRTALPSR